MVIASILLPNGHPDAKLGVYRWNFLQMDELNNTSFVGLFLDAAVRNVSL